MADNGKSKSKKYRSTREDRVKSSRKSRQSKESYQMHAEESTTPPLPGRSISMEELIKQRKDLKKQLKDYNKQSHSGLHLKFGSSTSHKTDRHSKNDYIYDIHHRKRKISSHEYTSERKKNIKDISPEHNGDYAQVESDDEESEIEKRRQQRKELVNKLNISKMGKINEIVENTMEEARNVLQNEKFKTTAPSLTVPESSDMFADKDEFAPKTSRDHVTQDNSEENAQHLADNWDDVEGYYNIKVGDIINKNQYIIKNILGKGVFANVVRAQDMKNNNSDVAIKIVRNNELMYKTGLKEVAILNQIRDADPNDKHHCVKYLSNFMHKGHLCLVMESLCMDLRSVIKRYGKHGINIKALVSYSRQLLLALKLLQKIEIIHADIKPDNIVVNEKKNLLKLCDFGSASNVDDNEPTPYLVSRFYRAPEIILGILSKHSVDTWSAACTIFEMATGKIMFPGSSNNKMLKCFMDFKGRFPTRLIRKGKFKDQHFNYNNNFLLHKKDEFSGRDKFVELSNVSATRDLNKELKKFGNTTSIEEGKKLTQLKDLLDKMLTIDPNQRLTINDCIKHSFIHE